MPEKKTLGYYAWRKRPAPKRAQEDGFLDLAIVLDVFGRKVGLALRSPSPKTWSRPVPKHKAFAALLFALICCPSIARALVVYDTFATGDGDTDIIAGQYNSNDLQYAYPFDMPLDSGNLPLETITIRLRNPAGTHGDFTLRLREDDNGAPGAVLEEWTLTTDLPSETNVTFDSLTQPLLLQGATYWLNLKIEAGTGVGWWMATIPKSLDLLYAETGVLDPTWLAPVDPFLVGLATVVVPEPDSLWLGAAGAAALVSLRRKRARA